MTDLPEHLADQFGLGTQLRRARRSVGLTQLELARLSGASERAIRNLEQGTVQARAATLDVVIAALGRHGVDVQELRRTLRVVREAAATTESPVPGQLPAAVPGFVGRTGELEHTRALLTSPDRDHPALVVISGAPGVGKTTLAVRAAQSVRAAFPDGQLYASLRGGSGHPASRATVLAEFLRALGAEPPNARVEEHERLFRSLTADRAVLVVLDDAADEASVRPLLPGGQRCAAVVTSRTHLSGLDGVHRLGLDQLATAEALELLASVAGPERIAADPESAARTVELCARLPLAVRIAGARLAVRPHWPLARLVERLTDNRTRLDTLSAGDRAVRATLAEACSALPDPVRTAFVLLASLPVPDFAPWLAEAVLDRSARETEDALDALVDAHLASVVIGPQGMVRYRFHDLLRAYAVELDDSAGDGARRAVAAALAAAEQVDRVLQHRFTRASTGVTARLPVQLPDVATSAPPDWFDAEIAGLLGLLGHASATPGLEAACWQLSACLDGYLEMRGELVEWRRAQDLALDAARRGGDALGEAIVLRARGELLFNLDEIPEGLDCLSRSQELIAGRGDQLSEAHLVRAIAYGRLQLGDLAAAADGYATALARFVELGDRAGQADAASGLGTIQLHEGRSEAARGSLAIALAAYRELGEHLSFASMSLTAGTLEAGQQRYEAARRHFLESLATARMLHHDGLTAAGLLTLGDLYRVVGRTRRATTLLRSACRLAERCGDRSTLCSALRNRARLERDLGDHAAALGHLDRARAIAEEIRSPLLMGAASEELGNTFRELGDTSRACAAWADAYTAFGTVSPKRAAAVSQKLAAVAAAG